MEGNRIGEKRKVAPEPAARAGSALKPRKAVQQMAPYSPPTAGRLGKLRLDFNENTVGCSPKVAEFLSQRLTREYLAIYPEYAEPRQRLSGFFGVSADQLLLTNGTDEAIQVLVNTYVDAGDQVLLLRPAYAMYRFYCEVAGANIKEFDYKGDTLAFPLEKLLAGIGPRTRAILIANPNNPTGTGIPVAGIRKILERAPGAAVLVDEAYYEFSGVTALGLLNEFPNLFVSRTFSKVYGLAGLRMGCLFSQPGNIEFLHKAQSPYSVNIVAALAACAAAEDGGYVAAYVTEVLAARELLYVGLERLGIPYVESEANFVLMRMENRAIEVRDALRAKGVLVRDRSYELPGMVRVTVGTRSQIRRFLDELAEVW